MQAKKKKKTDFHPETQFIVNLLHPWNTVRDWYEEKIVGNCVHAPVGVWCLQKYLGQIHYTGEGL